MTASKRHLGRRALTIWIATVQRRPRLALLLALALAVAALYQTVANLGISTSTADMISDSAPFMRTYNAYKAPFPHRQDNFVIVVEADTADRVREAVDRLSTRLKAETGLFAHVYAPGAGPFFDRNGLLYLDRDELLDLLDSLAASQPLLQRLRQDMSLRGLLAVLGLAINDAIGGGNRDGIDWLFDRMARATTAALDGRPARLSWQEIMYGHAAEPEDLRGLIFGQPKILDFDSLLPGATGLAEARRLAAEEGITAAAGLRLSLTGPLALAHDELATVARGAKLAGLLSLTLVTLILIIGLRSLRLVVISLATLILGLIWTAGFATLAIGHLNLISIAFAVLFVSLGIDFSIHMCLRVRELCGEGLDCDAAVRESARSIGGALSLCALTTAVGFYTFLPTDYSGVSELGVIAGTGMFIALFANLTVLPALLTLWPLPAKAAAMPAGGAGAGRRAGWPERHSRAVRAGAVALAVVSLVLVPKARFDFNPINLQDPQTESVRTLRMLMAEGRRDMWAAGALAPDIESARQKGAAFKALDVVDSAVSLADFVPPAQDERRELIEDIAFAVEPGLFAADGFEPPTDGEQADALRQFAAALDRLIAADGTLAGARALRAAVERALAAGGRETIGAVEQALIGALPGRLAALDTALTAEPFALGDLPSALVDRYRGRDGSLRVQIFPAEDIIADNDALRRFVAALRTVDPNVTDDPVVILEAGNTVIGAFAQALISAVVIIALLLLLLTRSWRDSALVLCPLALAGLLTGATTVAIDMPFNFANIIVLPLLIGIGVHSAVHLMHRYRTDPDRPLLETSTARAVWFSALTTIAGFGSLAVSRHVGTASMGLLLMIGVGYTLLCTLVLLPALLTPVAPTRRRP